MRRQHHGHLAVHMFHALYVIPLILEVRPREHGWLELGLFFHVFVGGEGRGVRRHESRHVTVLGRPTVSCLLTAVAHLVLFF